MQRGQAAAAQWVIFEFPLTHDPIDLEALIVRIGTEKTWFSSADEAQEQAEKWKDGVATRLTKFLNDSVRRGWPSRFEFNSSDHNSIQGSSFIEGTESKELQQEKRARIHMDTYLKFAQVLTGRHFEAVCRGILSLMGCENPVLTPRSNDQGIDFYGLLRMTGRLNRTYERGIDRAMRSWVIGQAKQVGEPVGTAEVRELLGSLELARHGINADKGRSLAQLDLKAYDSIFPFFITTGTFSRDAWSLIDQTGLVGMDGPVVAAFLADHCVADVNGACKEEAFQAWVASELGVDDGADATAGDPPGIGGGA